jgi:hypothetical protein
VSVLCTALRDLPSGTVLSTVPVQAMGAGAKGMLARIENNSDSGRTLSVLLRDVPLFTVSMAEIGSPGAGSEPAVTRPGLAKPPGLVGPNSDADQCDPLVAHAGAAPGNQWLALTPPRLPRLATLNSLVGSADPVLMDFHVGLAFPCQHPFDHRDGVAQMPGWRILPDKLNSRVSETWQDDSGGGPLGWINLLLQPRTRPAYLDHDWTRDWGELQQFQFATGAQAPPAAVDVRVENRWGWVDDSPIWVR